MVVFCDEDEQEIIVTQNTGSKKIDKTYSFDNVFGPGSKQKDLYDQVVDPIVKEANGEFHKDVGVIPRAVEQLFDTLEAQNAEYSVKVTYIELYNEEITDLLAPEEKYKKPISLMEDGKGAVFMRGLEEELVCSADEIYHILQKGDSKLTRLLRDSLGGKTKTCIIATVSPSVNSLEETQSTLDYAYRAKSIKNRPEVNHKVTKSVAVKELYTEIDSLKQELHATREKNGIYIPNDRYMREEAAKKEMTEKLELKSKELMDLQELLFHQQKLTSELSQRLENTERQLYESKQDVSSLKDKLRHASDTAKEKEYLILNLLGSEKTLTEKAVELHSELENATSEVSSLFAKIEHKNHIEDGNKVLVQSFQTLLAQHLEVLHKIIVTSVTHQEQHLNAIEEHMKSFVSEEDKVTEGFQIRVEKIRDIFSGGIKSLAELAIEFSGNSETALGGIKSEVVEHSSALAELIREASVKVGDILNDLHCNLNDQEQSIAAFWKQQHESQLRAYQATQSASSVTVNFFKTMSHDIFRVIEMVEDARTKYDKQLSDFKIKFEDYTNGEDKQLLDKMAELLASSNAKKKQLKVQKHEMFECPNRANSSVVRLEVAHARLKGVVEEDAVVNVATVVNDGVVVNEEENDATEENSSTENECVTITAANTV
nr:kinesin-like protein KIN-5D isoform X2 [Tanacetum cinerariifolium]